MSTSARRPDNKPEDIDEETRRILAERDATFERDKPTAREKSEVMAEVRRKLKQHVPR